MIYRYSIILITTTVTGGVIQVICKNYDDIPTKNRKMNALIKFLAKKGLLFGFGVGGTVILIREGIVIFQTLSAKPKVPPVERPKSFREIATSPRSLGAGILGLIIGIFIK